MNKNTICRWFARRSRREILLRRRSLNHLFHISSCFDVVCIIRFVSQWVEIHMREKLCITPFSVWNKDVFLTIYWELNTKWTCTMTMANHGLLYLTRPNYSLSPCSVEYLKSWSLGTSATNGRIGNCYKQAIGCHEAAQASCSTQAARHSSSFCSFFQYSNSSLVKVTKFE